MVLFEESQRPQGFNARRVPGSICELAGSPGVLVYGNGRV